jgi:OPA family glycerol-3-phosphate transporter-like MFS transporter
MAKASVIMGTTVAVGTFFVYGTSAVYAGFTSFKAAFFTAAIVLISVATVWILFISKLMEAQQKEEEVVENTTHTNIQTATGKQTKKVIYFTICILSFCGIITNLIKDGLGTWVPSILKGNYGLNDSLSIILTLALPIVAIFGNAFAVAMHEKMGDFVYQCALMFAISGAFIMVVIASFSLDGWWLLLVCFTVVTLLVSSCNSLITSIFPLFMRGKLNSGLIAGVLNGFCYVGSTLSTYGLAVIADKSGWMAVFWTLFWCCVAVLVATMIYFIVRKFVLRAGAREPREEA